MGDEIQCRVQFAGETSLGKALLETDEVLFRGPPRLKISFRDIAALRVEDGTLAITWTGGVATFELGARAEKWAQKIRSPKSLIDKLGVKAGQKVSAVGALPPEFLEQLRERLTQVDAGPGRDNDLLFFAVSSRRDLNLVPRMRKALKPEGGLWIIRPKEKSEISESDVRSAARQAGLVDVKVARFSQTHTADKYVIPKAER